MMSALGIAMAVLVCAWRQVESLGSNIDLREPVLRLSPGLLNGTHYKKNGEDLFGYAFAFHEMEQIEPNSDRGQEAARKTR